MRPLHAQAVLQAESEGSMTEYWGHYEQWKLRLMNLGEKVVEAMCDGPVPSIGARIYHETDADNPDMVKRTMAIVTAQDAHIDRFRCCLLVIARVERCEVFSRKER